MYIQTSSSMCYICYSNLQSLPYEHKVTGGFMKRKVFTTKGIAGSGTCLHHSTIISVEEDITTQ